MYLSKLKPGQSAVVTGICADGSIRRRLQDIGIINGTYITCIMESPLRDPVAYLIRGAVIALRSEDAKTVNIKPIVDKKVTPWV